MHIQFLKDFSDNGELLHRQGERVHVPASVGENLIFTKVAVLVKYASYVESLNEHERLRTGVPLGSTAVVNVAGVEYSFGLSYTGTPCIFRKHATETAIILDLETAKSCGVPKNIITKFAATLDATDGTKAGAALHAAKLAQQQQDLTFGK